MVRFASVFFLLCLIALLWSLHYRAEQRVAKLGQPFPPIQPIVTVKDAAIPQNTKRMVNLFASWCPPCIAELPYLKQLTQQTGLPLIGIAWRDKKARLQDWIKEHDAPFQVVYADERGRIGRALQLQGIPQTYILDEDNVIVMQHQGPIMADDVSDLANKIKALP